MITIVGFSGSLRRESYNTALLRAAVAAMPPDSQLLAHSIAAFPLYNADDEARGIPQPVTRLKEAIAAADGLLIATPEYNNSIPGVAKNAVDWLSRPDSDVRRVFARKPVAVLGASPSRFGTILSQNAWLPVLRTLHAELWSDGRLMVTRADQVFGADGRIVDPAIDAALKKFLAEFVAYARSRATAGPKT